MAYMLIYFFNVTIFYVFILLTFKVRLRLWLNFNFTAVINCLLQDKVKGLVYKTITLSPSILYVYLASGAKSDNEKVYIRPMRFRTEHLSSRVFLPVFCLCY